MSETEQCDVLICGAGPAGSTAALELARAGHHAVLVDKESFPRDKVCAGWVNARVFTEFDWFEGRAVEVTERAFSALTFFSPNLGQRITYRASEPQGYIVRRRDFDNELVRLAREAGADFIDGVAVTQLWQSNDGVLVGLDDGRRYNARFLLGADGVETTVGKLSGLSPGFKDDQLVVAVEQEFSDCEDLLTELEGGGGSVLVALAYDYVPGYGWVFPRRSSASVGVGARMDRISNIRETHRKFVGDMVAGGLLPEQCDTGEAVSALIPAGAALTMDRLAEGRVLLVGDAGGFVAAASGEGIFPGMISGRAAARAISEGLGTGSEETVAERYSAAVKAALTTYLQMPALDLSLVMDLLFRDQRVADKMARAFLFGEPV